MELDNCILNYFSDREVELLLNALIAMEKKHAGVYSRTINSGYGSVSTQLKAEFHKDLADEYAQLAGEIAEAAN